MSRRSARSTTAHVPARGTARLGAVLAAVTLLPTGCGVPTDGAESIDGEDVPYNLMIEPSHDAEDTTPSPSGSIAFWTNEQGRLVPRAVAVDCSDALAGHLARILDALTSGPAEEDRDEGLSTAVPPDAVLELLAVDDGEARVDLEALSPIGADRLPLAVAQIVLTLTSVPDVTEVTLYDDGEALPIPGADGALTSSPVSASDYEDLVPERYRDHRPFVAGSTTTNC